MEKEESQSQEEAVEEKLKERFSASDKVIERAKLIYSQTSEQLIGRRDFSADVESALRKDDQENIRKIERLLRISEIKEGTGAAQTPTDSIRTSMKIFLDGRQPVAKERKIIEGRASAVSSFAKELGHQPSALNDILNRTLICSKEFSFDGMALSSLDPSFIWLKEKVVRNPKLLSIIDHELLHLCQSPECPKGLSEGVTTLYQQRIARRDGIRNSYSKDYLIDALYCRVLEKIIGQESMASMYFSGSLSGLKGAFNEKEGILKLTKSIHAMQRGQELGKKSYKHKKDPFNRDYLRLTASLLNKAVGLAILLPFYLKKK